jgi:tetratricopeptide (TPR) repeat protein
MIQGLRLRRSCLAWRESGRRAVRSAAVVVALLLAPTASAQAPAARDQVPEDQLVFAQATRALAHGRVSEAETLVRSRGTTDPVAAAVLAQLAVRGGHYADAGRMLEPVAAAHPSSEAALELGLLQMMLGDKPVGRRTLSGILGDAGTFRTAGELLRAARAARALGQFRSANALFREAAALAPGDPAINTAWGDLFLEKYNRSDAQQSFQAALETDRDWAPAHAGLARALAEDDPPAAGVEAGRALAIDEGLMDPILLQAELALDADKEDAARRLLDEALAIDPNRLEAHALRAAMAYVDDRPADYDAEVARALAINPNYGDVYRMAGNHAARHYRFDEAVDLVRKAIALEPDNMAAYADLGMHLLRTGDEAEARRVLDRAFRADPYDVVTYNLLGLLDTLQDFETFKTGDAIVRLSPAEADVLKEYALPIIDRSFADLEARYQFTPTGPILVEIFPRHDDFAVRTLGLPGMLGALGACFGRVVTLDSPRARPPGTFNWNATLYHELAHVITLQLSKQRVPRWLTEGASVYEEGRVRAEWAQDMEVPFARWYHEGKAPKIRDLNAGFTRPDTIALAYFQASLIVEQIVDSYGMSGLRALLVAYGNGLDTEAAVQQAFGVELDALQKAFDERLARRFGALGDALQVPEGVSVQGLKDPAEARRLAGDHPGSYPVQLAAGRVLAATDPAAATAALERAAALVPMATGSDSAHGVLAALAEKQGDPTRAMRELRLLLTHDHTNVEAARTLAALATKAGDEALERFALERVVMLDPYDPGAHTAFGRLALEGKDVALAMREFQAALAAGPVDLAAAHCDLGETYFLAGRKADAKRQALAALEIAPTFERAQDLLLKVVEGDG